MEVLDEHTELHLASVGPHRLLVLKIVRELTGLGLSAAKSLMDSAPVVIKHGMSTDDARKAKRDLEQSGAEASVKWIGS